jgi:hypothetical protein
MKGPLMNTVKNDAKKLFLLKGTCSNVLCFMLNREFGYPKETEGRASDLLAGGIMQKGQQCGMLWGSTLAAGAESSRMYSDRNQAIAKAITAAQHLVKSFSKRAKCVNCRDITKSDWTSVFGVVKYFLTGKLFTCLNLAEKWAPEATQSARDGLSQQINGLSQIPLSCASEVAKRMGASNEEMVMVAGFAGGIGLSGNGCGALGAAIWMKSLFWCKDNPGKSPPFFNNSNVANIFKEFYSATHSEILCHKICGRYFESIDDHSEFVKNGGCCKLINVLARA